MCPARTVLKRARHDDWQAVLQYFHSYRQPWLKRDIISIIEEDEITELRSGPFISMHVRRGDKLVHEAKRYETEVSVDKRITDVRVAHAWCGAVRVPLRWWRYSVLMRQE